MENKLRISNRRSEALDALRGFSILAMVLSGSIAFAGVLPGWMYHAQLPPPLHKFDGTVPGITWVDLVFPFFIFSMGAAIPLSLQKYTQRDTRFWMIFLVAFRRFVLLVFFALFTQHLKAWAIAKNPGSAEQWLSILAFVLLFFQYYQYSGEKWKTHFLVLKGLSYVAAFYLLWQLPFSKGTGFQKENRDIIILVLANMALFGPVIWWLTRKQPLWRLGILPLVMGVFFAATQPGQSWTKELFNFNKVGDFKFDWLYQFYFLKYLFILIPGMFAGEWLMRDTAAPAVRKLQARDDGYLEKCLALVIFYLVVLNLFGLYTRYLLFNFAGSLVLCITAQWILRKHQTAANWYRLSVMAGFYLLMLGLFWEAFEGGIKKDKSTYSYYFVTTGLAFYSLVFFDLVGKMKILSRVTNWLALNGKNPLVAYVAGSLLVLPVLTLTGLKPLFDQLKHNAFEGLLKGILFTAVVSLVTVFFVKRRWFWKS
jgi:predicted acyltransferase